MSLSWKTVIAGKQACFRNMGLGFLCFLFFTEPFGCTKTPRKLEIELKVRPVAQIPASGIYSLLVTEDETIWFFGVTSGHDEKFAHAPKDILCNLKSEPSQGILFCQRYQKGKWTEPEIVTLTTHPGISVCPTVWDKNQPMIIWSESERFLFKGQLWQIRWKDKKWIDKRPVPGGAPIGNVNCCRDGQGIIHGVYVSPLSPREVYWIGPGEEYPNKPYEIIYKDQTWFGPDPMVEKNRWYYHECPALGVDPKGRVHMVAPLFYISLLGYGPRIFEYRLLGEKNQIDQISDWGTDVMDEPSLAVDAEGNCHLVYSWSSDMKSGCRYRLKKKGHWQNPLPVGHDGFDAVIANDQKGRIYCYWREQAGPGRNASKFFLQVWDAVSISNPVEIPGKPADYPKPSFFPAPDGSMYLTWVEWVHKGPRSISTRPARKFRFFPSPYKGGEKMPEQSMEGEPHFNVVIQKIHAEELKGHTRQGQK